MLGKLGIKTLGGCKCDARAREMDTRGPEWCDRNLDTIVGWLREEAKRRKLPFFDQATRLLVRHAIRKARSNSPA